MTRVNLHAGATLVNFADRVDAAEIEPRMNAVGVEIQGDGDDIEVTSPFSNAEESSLHAIGSRE